MKVLGSLRSFFSGQTQEAFGLGEKFPLTKGITKELRRHIVGRATADLTGYTFERRHSDFPHAKSDIVVYDASSKAVFDGRELSGGEVSFWSK